MKEKKNPSQRGILDITLLILIAIVASVVSHYLLMLSPSDTVIVSILFLLVVFVIYQYFQLRNIEARLSGITTTIGFFIDTLRSQYDELLKLPKNKKVMAKDLLSIFAQPLNKLFQDTSRAFIEIVLKSSSPEEHEGIRRLMEKANRGIITYEEAKRLRELLEEEKRKREDRGDTLGAIILGLLLLFILGLLASLFLRER